MLIDIAGILIVLLTLCGSSMTAPAPQGACTVEQPLVELVVWLGSMCGHRGPASKGAGPLPRGLAAGVGGADTEHHDD